MILAWRALICRLSQQSWRNRIDSQAHKHSLRADVDYAAAGAAIVTQWEVMQEYYDGKAPKWNRAIVEEQYRKVKETETETKIKGMPPPVCETLGGAVATLEGVVDGCTTSDHVTNGLATDFSAVDPAVVTP